MGMPTWEDIAAEMKEIQKQRKDFEKHLEMLRLKEQEKKGIETLKKENNNFHGNCDRPGTMENGTATLFWLVAMIVSILFKGGWILCILETIIWWKFITRHN